jgi:hypothetical protein
MSGLPAVNLPCADEPRWGGSPDRMPSDLEECERQLGLHLETVYRRFGGEALGVIDLPPLDGARLQPEQIRIAAVLFWAREVEAAGVLRFCEALAQGMALGRLGLPLERAAQELMVFHRARQNRLNPGERSAIFARMFDAGTGSESGFEPLLAGLIEALVAIHRQPAGTSTTPGSVRAAAAGRALAELLAERAVGLAAFAARDIVDQIRWALRLLQHPEIERALGGGGLVPMLRRHGPLVLGEALDPSPHLSRAGAGLHLLTWIADRVPELETGSLRLTTNEPALAYAEELRASRGGV